jgi:hypothetical protein
MKLCRCQARNTYAAPTEAIGIPQSRTERLCWCTGTWISLKRLDWKLDQHFSENHASTTNSVEAPLVQHTFQTSIIRIHSNTNYLHLSCFPRLPHLVWLPAIHFSFRITAYIREHANSYNQGVISILLKVSQTLKNWGPTHSLNTNNRWLSISSISSTLVSSMLVATHRHGCTIRQLIQTEFI